MPLQRDGNWLLVGLAVVAAAIFAAAPRPTSTDNDNPAKFALATGPSEATEPALSRPGSGPLNPVYEFFRAKEWSKENPRPTSFEDRRTFTLSMTDGLTLIEKQRIVDDEASFYQWGQCCHFDDVSLRFLVATVPDPVDSGLPHLFDQTVEAMLRALERADYVMDRHWFPWQRSQKKHNPRLHERHPGAILLRRIQKDPPKNDPASKSRQELLPWLFSSSFSSFR